MRSFSVFAVAVTLYPLSIWSEAGRSYSLPASATISITSSTLDLGKAGILPANPQANCDAYRPTNDQIRKQFATYRRLKGWNAREHPDRLTCEVDGIVSVNGKHYEWQSHQGGIMDTSYPNGVWKTLGVIQNSPDR